MGFLTGHELTWMPEALQILRDELPNIDVMISSQYSPQLASALVKGTVDAAFLRREQEVPDLVFRLLVKEPLVVVLPSDHRLAALKAISPRDLVGETFVTVSDTAPVLRVVIDDYLKGSGVNITPDHEADHLAMGMSLIASTRGVGLLPIDLRRAGKRRAGRRPPRRGPGRQPALGRPADRMEPRRVIETDMALASLSADDLIWSTEHAQDFP